MTQQEASFVFTARDGTIIDFNEEPLSLLSWSGLGLPTAIADADQRAGAGVITRSIRYEHRSIALGVLVAPKNAEAQPAVIDRLTKTLAAAREGRPQHGVLAYTRWDGKQFEIECSLRTGLELPASGRLQQSWNLEMGVTFVADVPFFRSPLKRKAMATVGAFATHPLPGPLPYPLPNSDWPYAAVERIDYAGAIPSASLRVMIDGAANNVRIWNLSRPDDYPMIFTGAVAPGDALTVYMGGADFFSAETASGVDWVPNINALSDPVMLVHDAPNDVRVETGDGMPTVTFEWVDEFAAV